MSKVHSLSLLACGGGGEQLVLADCLPDRVPALQKAWRFLENRRPEVYGRLTGGK